MLRQTGPGHEIRDNRVELEQGVALEEPFFVFGVGRVFVDLVEHVLHDVLLRELLVQQRLRLLPAELTVIRAARLREKQRFDQQEEEQAKNDELDDTRLADEKFV